MSRSKQRGRDEELRQRQVDELEVLKAIYVGDVEEVAVKPKDPLQYSVRLLPQRGSSSGVGQGHGQKIPTYLTLHLLIPLDYPQMVPELTVLNSKGLSSQELEELRSELGKMCEECIGQEMIYQLLSHAETYLYTHQKTSVGSFHDEMILRQKQVKEAHLQSQVDLKEKERMAIREEIIRKQNEEREELKKVKEQRRSQPISTTLRNNSNSSPGESPNGSPTKSNLFPGGGSFKSNKYNNNNNNPQGRKKQRRSTSEGSGGDDNSYSESCSELSLLEFTSGKNSNLFYRGEVLGQSERGSKVYCGLSRSGNLVAISEWRFVAKLDKKGKEIKVVGTTENCLTLDNVIKQVHGFQTDLGLLQKLDHPNIILYFGVKSFTPQDEPGNFLVDLAQEFVRGTTLQSYLQQGAVGLDIPLVRRVAKGILQGLSYLHKNDVVHRWLRDTSIFLDTTGEVRLTDYGIERKLTELLTSFNKSPEVPDPFPPSIGRGGKKGDIYRFGTIILSLVHGSYLPTSTVPSIPTDIPSSLQDFLRRCLTPIEHSRWSAQELLAHDFLKIQLTQEIQVKFRRPDQFEAKVNKGTHHENEEEEEERDALPDLPGKFSIPQFKGHGRLQSEFEVLEILGHGGFGEVLKVKNQLDSRIYALKRIRLNPKNKQLNKKITREVKLLSQLNHENVVRYFNSWIETVIESDDETTTTESVSTSLELSKRVQRMELKNKQNSLGFLDNVEDLAPNFDNGNSEWSVSIAQTPGCGYESDESSEDDLFGTSFRRLTIEDSEEIIFEDDEPAASPPNGNRIASSQSTENENDQGSSEASKNLSSALSVSAFLHESQYLYIQMEFCEKSTLKTAIENNLYEDVDRAWRLFREIVEGLVHIHQQGMIHRDLKPVNIFLDLNDHVKIGDFGLATTSNIIPKSLDDTLQEVGGILGLGGSLDFTDDQKTGQVGTALYVAPELMSTGQRASYNQKVDIYSLGIILFEMFYHPTSTGMERVRVIMSLRKDAPVFPDDFDQSLFPQVTHITTWLLNHDHTKRPSSAELLQSDYLPPPHLEEAELRDIFTRTLRSSKTKSYKYLIASCFGQEVGSVENATYDLDVGKVLQTQGQASHLNGSLFLIQRVKKRVVQVFERHGAIELHTPLLMPKSSAYSETDAAVNLLNHGGGIVSIPYDLRLGFARYVGRTGVAHLKRYAIDKVYRERRVFGLHPRELVECAFDIVYSQQGSLVSDAEVLSVAFEVLQTLPWMAGRAVTVRLGHTKLLRGIMLHHGIDQKHHETILKLLSDVKNERDCKQRIETHLCSLGLSDAFISSLLQLMGLEGPFSKINSLFKGIVKRKGEAGSCIKEALHELEVLVNNMDAFGLQCSITIAPAMTFCSRIYSGLLFQVACDMNRRGRAKDLLDVVAAGGRYDELIQEFRSTLYFEQEDGSSSIKVSPCGVGISISLDKLLQGFPQADGDGCEENETLLSAEWTRRGPADVLICVLGHHQMVKEKIDMAKELMMSHGIHAQVLDGSQTLEAAEEMCKDLGARFLVMLKEWEYPANLRIRTLESGRITEKKLSKTEAVEYISRRLVKEEHRLNDQPSSLARSDSSVLMKQGNVSDSTVGQSSSSSSSGLYPPYNITILMNLEKDKLPHVKRRYEHQIMSRVPDTLVKLGRSQSIEILGLEVSGSVIHNLATLPLHDKDEFAKVVVEVLERHPRMKKFLKGICDATYELIYEKNTPVIILFGLIDNSCRVLM